MYSPFPTPSTFMAASPSHAGLEHPGDGDLREMLLTDWLASSDDDWLQKEYRSECVEILSRAMGLADGADPVGMNIDQALELPPHDLLRAAGLTAPRLKPVMNFSEWRGAQAMQQSLNALAVEEVAVSKLANGRLPRDCHLESVRALDLSMTVGDVDWASLLESLASWPSLEAVLLPSHEHAIQCPAGWSYVDDQHCLLPDRGRAATSPRPFSNAARQAAREAARAQAESAFEPFFKGLKQLLRMSTAVAAPTIQAHRLRLKEVQRSLVEHPELNAVVHKLLLQEQGACVDAGLRRLDDIQMLLHCSRLTSPADAAPMALHVALLRRADQSQAIGRRNDNENIEYANALRTLVGQRLNECLGSELRVASAPVFSYLGGLRGVVAPGETPALREWPVELRKAADEVFHGEVAAGFTSLALLLAEEEGTGALIAEVLAGDPAYQADLKRLEDDYQFDYEAAQDADPDNPFAGSELQAVKEQKRLRRLVDLLAPWTDRLAAWVRANPAARTPSDEQASDSEG